MKWLKNNLNWLLSVVFMLMTLTVFGPLELYLTNSSEFWFDFPVMLKITGILTGVGAVVLLSIGLLLRGKARSLYAAILFAVTLCLYVQGNFLNIDYGVLDGRTIDWSAYGSHAVTNTILWVAIIGSLLFLWKKKPEFYARASKIASSCLIAMQVLTLGILLINSEVLTSDKGSRMTTEHMMEVGSEDNIIIFVLDTFDDPTMDALLEADKEHYQSLFSDFTRFTDCSAGGATTAAAMPILISGEYYSNGISYAEYVNHTFNADGLYSELQNQDYNIGLYTNSAYIGNGANGYVDNYVYGTGHPSSYSGLASKYSSFTLFKYMPHILKQFFWLYTAEFDTYKPGESYVHNDAAFYNTLVTERLQVVGKNSFRLIHLQGPHYPYTINEYAQPDTDATREQQARGNLYIVEEYINQLKACNVYDNAMIIVTADHGNAENYSAPILFVKERGTSETFKVIDTPTSHIDLHPTLFSYLGKDTGDTFFEISDDPSRERMFYLLIQQGGSFYMREHVIMDKVSVVGRGTETGNILAPISEKAPVVLGETMSLGLDGTGNEYIVSGFDAWPVDSVVTQGKEAIFAFDIESGTDSDLTVSIEVLRLYDDPRDQSVEIYANGELVHTEEVMEPKTLTFTVPAQLLDSETLELKLVCATRLKPLYLSAVTICSAEATGESSNFSITDIVAIPLTALMMFCYNLLGNYGLTIIVFTFLSKIILLPVSMWVHKNGITMVKITPELNRVKIKHYGDRDAIDDATQALYKREKYNPLASTVPMVVQIVMLLGVIGAVKNLLADADSVLTLVPSEAGGITYLMPLAAGAAALVLGLAQNHLSPLQREQGKKEQWMSNAFSIGISLFLGAFVSLGVGIYWIASNLLSIVQQMLLNVMIKPEKHIDYQALEESKKELAGLDSLSAEVSKEDKKREQEDYKKFFSVANKHLVIYSEKSGFYKYYKDVMDFMLKYSNVIIHYVTNDPKDQIFNIAESQPRIKPYYISEKKLITLLMKMDADIVVMTCPDLDRYHLKRSYVRKDIEYVYMFHYPLSTHMVLNTGALDHYDTILCVGDFQFEEIRAAEKLYNLPEKKLISAGYGQLEQLYNSYQKMEKIKRDKPKILIAPSWQQDNILDSCLDSLLEQLLGKGYELVIRPHPEYVKRYKPRMDAIVQKYSHHSDLTFELDFTSNNSLFDSDILISDWSGSAYEFSLVTLKPAVFVNTPPKINNPEYDKLNVEPLEFKLRGEVGIQIDPNNMENLADKINALVDSSEEYAEKIEKIRNTYIANFGHSGEVGGKYILEQLLERQKNK